MSSRESYATSLVILKKEVKTMTRHHCTPTGVGKVTHDHTRYGGGCGGTAAQALPGSMSTGSSHSRKQFVIHCEVDHEHSQGSTQPPSLYGLCHLSSVQLLSSVPTRSVRPTSFSSEVSQTPSFLSAPPAASFLSTPPSDAYTHC